MAGNVSTGVFIYPGDQGNQTITEKDLNFWYLFNIKYTMSAGSQFGALFVMFFVTWIMTSNQKRKTPVFVLNMLSMGFGALRSCFSMLGELSRFNQLLAWFTNDLQYITAGDETIVILAIIFQWLMLISINTSLVLNAYTVCKTVGKRIKHIITVISVFFLISSGSWRFAQLVLNIQGVLGTNFWIYKTSSYWFLKIGLAFETGSLWWFCCVFSGKLILTQRDRNKLGLKAWPATQLLSSMAGATMIIPSGFAILEWTSPFTFPFAFSLTLTLVALLLPLSSLWAAKVTRDGASEFTSNRLWGGYSGNSNNQSSFGGRTWVTDSSRDINPRHLRERKSSLVPLNTINKKTTNTSISSNPERDSIEIDIERIGVCVNKSYSVHSRREF